MDNRLQKAIEVVKQIKEHEENNTIIPLGYSKITIPALQTLISYAEQGLKLEGVMPKKVEDEVINGEHMLTLSDKHRNELIDQCIHALIQKLDVEKIAELVEEGMSNQAPPKVIALSIKEYLLGTGKEAN